MTKIAAPLCFITTCKGRLDHLKETLPLLTEVENACCVVVDYGCPQNSGAWVRENFPGVHVEFVNDDAEFCAARARNLGALATQSLWLCFIDADIRIRSGFSIWLAQPREANGIYRAVGGDVNMYGTVICHADAFRAVGGYDEVIRGWGGEDDDLYLRLRAMGGVDYHFPAELIDPIKHNDADRTTFHAQKDHLLQLCINFLYIHVKSDIRLFAPQVLTVDGRQKIMAEANKAVLAGWASGTTARLEVELPAIGVHQVTNCAVSRKIVYEVSESQLQRPINSAAGDARAVSAEDNQIIVGNGTGNDLKLKVIPGEATQILTNEIFLGNCYAAPLLSEQAITIVDIGAGVGLTAAYFRLIYPQSKIYCFESDVVALPILQDNVAVIGNGFVNPQESTSHATGNATALDALAFLKQIDILKLASVASNLPILSSLRQRLAEIATIFVEFASVATRDKTTALLGEALRDTHVLWKVNALSRAKGVHGVLIYVQKPVAAAIDAT